MRYGAWIQTHLGHKFYPLDPEIELIDIYDIAQSLGKVCRFTGHCREFYSVAQHSMLVSYLVPEEMAMEGLLHDAAEAYLGDMARPLKHLSPIGWQFREAEARLEQAIAERFRLQYPWPPEVKVADNLMLTAEARDLMQGECYVKLKEQYGEPDAATKIYPMPHAGATALFLERFQELQRKRNG